MPMNLRSYPNNWKAFSREIRFGRAAGQCECSGECGRHGVVLSGRSKGMRKRCLAIHGDRSENGRGTVVLTTAHLWKGPCRCALENEGQKCARPDHVRAMCQGCHLRYDKTLHADTRGRTRARRSGQGLLFGREKMG